MPDLIMNLASLKNKADIAGRTNTATDTYPSLCPPYNTIVSYINDGAEVVAITGSYSNNQLVKDADVTIGARLDNPVTVTGNALTYNGSVLNLITVSNKPSGCTVYFRVGSSGSWTTTIPTATNAMSATTIYWYATSTITYKNKYSESSPGSVSASIGKAPRTLAWTVTLDNLECAEHGTIAASPSGGVGDGTITYSTSDPDIAVIDNVDQLWGVSGASPYGSTCTVTATISEGTNWQSASCSYVGTFYNKYNGLLHVDLGLPSGTIWAAYNLGTDSPAEYGNYYRYGLTEPFASGLTAYSGTENPLSMNYDAARLNWEGLWHIPTYDLILELKLYTTQEWTTIDDDFRIGNGTKYGVKCTSTINSKWIFIIAGGYYTTSGTLTGSRGTYDGQCRYWTSTPSTSGKSYYLYVNRSSSASIRTGDSTVEAGLTIRPVVG